MPSMPYLQNQFYQSKPRKPNLPNKTKLKKLKFSKEQNQSAKLADPNDNQSQTSSSLPWAWHSWAPACLVHCHLCDFKSDFDAVKELCSTFIRKNQYYHILITWIRRHCLWLPRQWRIWWEHHHSWGLQEGVQVQWATWEAGCSLSSTLPGGSETASTEWSYHSATY